MLQVRELCCSACYLRATNLRWRRGPGESCVAGTNEIAKVPSVLMTGVVVLHLGTLLVFLTGVSPVALLVFAVMFVVRATGITTGYHRYFSHRSFKTSRPFQFVLALWGTLAAQGGLSWWVSHHRDHHRFTDTEKDIHSPTSHGFLRGHITWLFTEDSKTRGQAQVQDIDRFPELRWLEAVYLPIMIAQGAGLFFLGVWLDYLFPGLGTSGLQLLVWGFFISTVAVLHTTFAVNSVCHMWGSAPHDAGDDSKNNFVVGLLAMGEGWHNNHHAFAYSARHGLEWWQIDVTWYLLIVLEKLGIVWDLKLPRPAVTVPVSSTN